MTVRTKIRIVSALIAGLLTLLLAASPATARVRLKFATMAPKGLGWQASYDKLVVPWLYQATDDTYVTKVYWGGIMGNDDDYLRKMNIGQLQGGGLTGMGANLACPEFSVVSLPFLFNGYDEVDYIRETMGPTFDFYFLENGYKLFFWLDADFELLFSTKYKFDKLEDFRQTRILTWFGPQEVTMLRALGANPIPMDVSEVAMGKRTGILDTNIAPSLWQVGSQLYTIDKYVNLMKIRYSPAVIMFTKEVWDDIPDNYREIMMATDDEVRDEFNRDIRRDNEKGLEAMINYGVEPVMPSPENLAEIRKAAMTVYEDMSGNLYPVELLQEVTQHLAVYRQAGGRPSVVVAARPVSKPVKVARPVAKPVKAEPAPAAKAAEKPAPAPEKAEMASSELDKIAKAHAQREEALKKAADERPVQAPAVKKAPKRSAWAERKRQITEVQKVLKPLGLYKYRVDGIYGPVTRRGIITYQEMTGLPATGVVDRKLLDHMGID